MLKRLFLILVLYLFFYSVSSSGNSDLENHIDTESLISKVLEVEKPNSKSNAFAHWTYNTAIMTASYCWRKYAKKKSPIPSVFDVGFTSAGVWRLTNKQKAEELCFSLATKGIHPICTHGQFWIANVKREPALPSHYLLIDKKHPLKKVEGVLTCYLNSDRIDQQSYVGPFTVEWLQKPSLKSINLPRGKEMREFGTVRITASDAPNFEGVVPYSNIRTAIYVKDK